MKHFLVILSCLILSVQSVFASSTLIWTANTKNNNQIPIIESWTDTRTTLQKPFIKGSSKEEVITKWKQKQEQERLQNWNKWATQKQEEIKNYLESKQTAYNSPYVMTPIGQMIRSDRMIGGN
jgi:hypothetical protein